MFTSKRRKTRICSGLNDAGACSMMRSKVETRALALFLASGLLCLVLFSAAAQTRPCVRLSFRAAVRSGTRPAAAHARPCVVRLALLSLLRLPRPSQAEVRLAPLRDELWLVGTEHVGSKQTVTVRPTCLPKTMIAAFAFGQGGSASGLSGSASSRYWFLLRTPERPSVAGRHAV